MKRLQIKIHPSVDRALSYYEMRANSKFRAETVVIINENFFATRSSYPTSREEREEGKERRREDADEVQRRNLL